MNWKAVATVVAVVASGLAGYGGGQMNQPPQVAQAVKSTPCQCNVILPKQQLDVTVHGAGVKK